MRAGVSTGWRPRAVGLVGAAAAGALLLAGCSSSPSSSAKASSSPTPGKAGAGSSGDLSALAAKMRSEIHGTFKAVYTYSGTGSTPQSVTIEQDPPKTLFMAGGADIIDNGTTTYYCSTQSSPTTCLEMSSSSNPLAGLEDAFDSSTVSTLFGRLSSEVAAHAVGVDVSYSSQTIAGQPSTCVSATHSGQSGTYCVTHAGLLALEKTASESFTLQSYSSIVSASDFSLPSGATVETIPSAP